MEDFWPRCEHHPAWGKQDSKLLTDYQSDTDENRKPGVSKAIPKGLGGILKRKSKGLEKPFELMGALCQILSRKKGLCVEHLEQQAQEKTQVLASVVADDMREPEPASRNSPDIIQEFFPDNKSHYFLDLGADIEPGGDATYERYYRTGHIYTDSETDEG